MDGLIQDFRYALRQMRHHPGYSTLMVLTLALGIGATTAMFSLVDRALFRSLPYPNDDQLVSVGVIAPIIDGEFLFAGNYLSWRRDQTPFSGFTSSTGVRGCDLTQDRPLRSTCAAVEATFLPTLGINALLGRNFTVQEDRPDAPPVALLSYPIWQTRFGGDPSIVGQTVSLDGKATRILGVLPRDFEFPTLAEVGILIPQALDESIVQRGQLGPVVRVYGRMKPGVGIESAAAQLQPLFSQFVAMAPPPFRKTLRLQVHSFRDLQMHDARLAAWLLLMAALVVLLIACANAASLALARSSARRHELAVRTALGAKLSRLFQQRLTESFVLALTGGIAGCGFAYAMVRALVLLGPIGIPHLSQASVDGRALLFTLLVSIAAGVLFGSTPALEKPIPGTLVSPSLGNSPRARIRQLLLVAQVGATVILLTGALLLVRSLRNLQMQPLGLNTQNVITGEITLGQQKYSDAWQRLGFFQNLESKLNQLPGVDSFALSDSLPPNPPARTMPFIALQAEGQQPLTAEQGIGGVVGWRSVTPGYFSAIGIPLRRGRAFNESDRVSNPGAIILNDRLANQLFPGQEPLGKLIRFRLDDQHFTAAYSVVGITANAQNQGLGGTAGPEYYMVRRHSTDDIVFHYPDSQRISIVVRSNLSPQAVSVELSDVVASIDPTIPVSTSTLSQIVYRLAERPRFRTTLLLLFAMVGLLLAAVGVYGLVATLVSQRTEEMAIHIALGAEPARLTRNIILQASRWVAVGAAIGLACSLGAARFIAALLFDIKGNDPLTLLEAVALLVIVAMAAAYVPARRASKVDPMAALRHE